MYEAILHSQNRLTPEDRDFISNLILNRKFQIISAQRELHKLTHVLAILDGLGKKLPEQDGNK